MLQGCGRRDLSGGYGIVARAAAKPGLMVSKMIRSNVSVSAFPRRVFGWVRILIYGKP